MRVTHAIIAPIPKYVRFEKKLKVDLALARKQLDQLAGALREAGADIIELSPDEDCMQQSLLVGDLAICINGTALITRPNSDTSRLQEVSNILDELTWQVVHTPATEHGKEVVLLASDVFYTGREIFVGTRKNGTNIEGAMVVGRTFADLNVIPIPLPGIFPLRHYVSLVTHDVIGIGNSKEAKQLLQRLERQATFPYKTLTVNYDEAVDCLNVNGCLIYRQDTPDTKFQILKEPVQLTGFNASELIKIGNPFSRYCLLVQKIRVPKALW